MESIVRAVGVLAMGLAIGIQVGGSVLRAPAAATDPDCVGGADGFVAVSSGQRGLVWRDVHVGRGVVSLEMVKVDGAIYGLARLGGGTPSGDEVWLDRSDAGVGTPTPCGPSRVPAAGAAAVSPAFLATDDPDRFMRACGRVDDVVRCTEWW